MADARMAPLMAGVFAGRGHQGMVVHGGDGLDELTTTTTSTVWVYADGEVSERELDPADLGIPRAAVADLVGGEPAVNAAIVRDLLDGRHGPVRDVVTLNAAATLVAYDGPRADDLETQLAAALERARSAIDSGAGKAKLAAWVAATTALIGSQSLSRRAGSPGTSAARSRIWSLASSGTELSAATTEPSSSRTTMAVTSSYRLGSPSI